MTIPAMEKQKTNKKFTSDLKFEVALEHRFWAVQRARKQKRFATVQQLCDHFRVSRSHLREWGEKLTRRGPEIFVHGSSVRRQRDAATVIEKQREYIAKLEAENDRLRSQLALESGPAAEDRMTNPPKIAP
jgi:uncharacterized protein YcaQ